jgi:hypothetical protein
VSSQLIAEPTNAWNSSGDTVAVMEGSVSSEIAREGGVVERTVEGEGIGGE